jgi:hypothetical protein
MRSAYASRNSAMRCSVSATSTGCVLVGALLRRGADLHDLRRQHPGTILAGRIAQLREESTHVVPVALRVAGFAVGTGAGAEIRVRSFRLDDREAGHRSVGTQPDVDLVEAATAGQRQVHAENTVAGVPGGQPAFDGPGELVADLLRS